MAQHNVRVTVGMPVYNGERYVAQAIESVLAQTYKDLVLIISDNGSTDRTQAICESYAARDARVQYRRYDENRGASWNFNNCVNLASTEYFKWQCYDDLLDPTMVEACVDVLDKEPGVVIAYPRTVVIDDATNFLSYWADGVDTRSPHPHERMAHFLYRRNKGHLESQFGVMRMSALRTTKLLGPIPYSDQVFLVEMHLRGQFRELEAPLFMRRIHPAISTTANEMYSLGFFLDPKRQGKLKLLRLERLTEFVKAIHRAHLGPLETARCYKELGPLVLSPANIARMGQDITAVWHQATRGRFKHS